ncbi:lipoprotein [Streptomyces sp. 900116325]
MKRVLAVLLSALVLTGCSSADPSAGTAAPTASTATKTVPSETPTEDPTPTEEPEVTVEITCDGEYFTKYQDAWANKYDMCEAEAAGTMDDTQTKAVSVAYGTDEDDLSGLGTLYSICAQVGPEALEYLDTAGSDDQVKEVTGAFILCPDHPDKGRVNKQLAAAKKRNKLEADGRIFGSGVYRIGSDIKPGTYYVEDVADCYWERTDKNGAPIDNYFSNGAKRVQVTIRTTDYSFNSEGCGEWKPVS